MNIDRKVNELLLFKKGVEPAGNKFCVSLFVNNVTGPEGVRGRNSDNTMFKEKFKWQPEINMTDGLRKTYEWIERQIENDKNER